MNITSLIFSALLITNNPGVMDTDYDKISQKENISVEIVSLRNETQKFFQLPNGHVEIRYYNSPIHYFDGEKFVEYENKINKKDDYYESSKNKYKYEISKENIEISYNDNNKIKLKFNKNTSVLKEQKIYQNEGCIYKDGLKYYDTNTSFIFENILDNVNDAINFTYTLYTDKLNNKGNSFIGENNEEIFTLGNHYLKSSNGKMLMAKDINLISIDESKIEVNVSYDEDVFVANELVAPYTISSELMYTFNKNNSSLNDKYIIDKTTYSYEGTTVLSGIDSMQIVNQYGNLINAKYIGIYEVDNLKYNNIDIDSDDFLNATFNIRKKTTSNVSLDLYRITNDVNYNNLNGTTVFNEAYIGYGAAGNTLYSFDITDELRTCLNNNRSLIMSLYGNPVSSTGYATLYSSESNNSYIPYISLEKSVFVGDAPDYSPLNNNTGNCLDYVLLDSNIVSFQLNKYNTNFSQQIINYIGSNNIRVIDNFDSDISANERRIYSVHIVSNNKIFEYHFLMQHSNCYWSGRNGNTIEINNCIDPNIHPQILVSNNTIVTYYAIK